MSQPIQERPSHALIGDDHRVAGLFEGGRSNEAKISAVHYVTFAFTPEQVEALTSGRYPVAAAVEHQRYRHETALSEETRRSLAEDLLAP